MIAIYPGTFDPVTFGHLDLIERGARMFDSLVVAVARNSAKAPLFPAEERLEMVREVTSAIPNLRVELFDSLLLEYARRVGAGVILRGLRAVSDFEYELQIALTNRRLAPELETIFMAPNNNFTYLSSSVVREIARYGGSVEEFVPTPVVARLRRRFTQTPPRPTP